MIGDAISNHRTKVFKILLWLITQGAFWFAVINYHRGLYQLALFELLVALLSGWALWRIYRPMTYQLHQQLATIYVALFGGFVLYAMNHPGVSQNIYIWISTLPLMAYLLLGSKRGLILTSGFFSLVLIIHLIRFDLAVFTEHVAAVANVVCVVMAIWGMSHAYELANEQASRQLQHMATRDHLTGLMNRSLLTQTFLQAATSTRFTHQVLGLIVADIDDFKSINDELGHDSGDQVLKTFAEILKAHDQAGKHAFRLGGEEFCLIVPATTADELQQIAESLRQQLQDRDFHQLGKTTPVTISCGLATSDQAAKSFDQLHREADLRMYQAKARGRNQVVSQG